MGGSRRIDDGLVGVAVFIHVGDPFGDIPREVVDLFGSSSLGKGSDGRQFGEAVGSVGVVRCPGAMVGPSCRDMLAPRKAPG